MRDAKTDPFLRSWHDDAYDTTVNDAVADASVPREVEQRTT